MQSLKAARRRVVARVRAEWKLWRYASVSSISLGKYIVLLASTLHILWGVLLLTNPVSSLATPLHILVATFGGRIRTAIVLFAVAIVAMCFVRMKAVHPHRDKGTSFMLIPQQTVLLISSIGSIVAVAHGMYADGVPRPWPFILADQLPIIVGGLYYFVVTIEVARNP